MISAILDSRNLSDMIVAKISEIEEFGSVLLTNPDTKAEFPVCVVEAPLQTVIEHGAGVDLSITVHVWAKTQRDTLHLYDLVKCKLMELNFTSKGNIPYFIDEVTKKWRYGGYFECRWNVFTNSLERNIR